MGEVETETLRLHTGFGEVDVPIDDIGEIVPVEGGTLDGSGNAVSVWLRNGSELRGEWTEPELAMGLQVGDGVVPVALPTGDLERFQLQGGEDVPTGFVYQVKTIWSDDFIVDGEETWIRLENELGAFTPRLEEITALRRQADGDWRMALGTGTVLIGPLTDDALTLALPLGPGAVEVPLSGIVSIERHDWGGYATYRSSWGGQGGRIQNLEQLGYVDDVPQPAAAPVRAAEAAADTGQWFDNSRQSGFKAMQ